MQILRAIRRFVICIIWPCALSLSPTIVGQTAQDANTLPPVVHLTAEQDHQRILDLLHITSLRRGPDGDPKSPNAANFDESKVSPYPPLPEMTARR
jgi:hypothetical protein